MTINIRYYSENAEKLSNQYDSVSFESVHCDWISFIPTRGSVLDIGAGSGRDARYLAQKGLNVIAAEPADGIREVAKSRSKSLKIRWVADSLPELPHIALLNERFDLILLSAVWMHVDPDQREACIRKLASILNLNGKVIISLRHGCSPDERHMYPVSAKEISYYASMYGLAYRLLTPDNKVDELGRSDVNWQTVMLTKKP